jgi:DNA-binding beta-propeller fold protein YncE
VVRVAAPDFREVGSKNTEADGVHRLRGYAFRPYLQGGSLTIDPSGRRIHALTGGELVVVDAETMEIVRRQEVCARAEQLVVADDGRAYVTCRGDGEVVALDADGAVVARRPSADDPFGIALSPTGRLLVTTTTPPRVTRLATPALEPVWTRAIASEPRGIAVAAGGDRAVVAHLAGPWVSVIDVDTGGAALAPLPERRDGWPSELFDEGDDPQKPSHRSAGGAFAVAASPGGTRAFVPYLLKNDGAEIDDFIPGCYANGSQLPIAASVAAVDIAGGRVLRPTPLPLPPGQFGYADFTGVNYLGQLGVVRAAFHDPVQSRLHVVGEGSGLLISFDTSKADPTSRPLAYQNLPGPARGLVVDPAGGRVFALLAFSEQLVVIDSESGSMDTIELGEPRADDAIARGRVLFHTANDSRLSTLTGVSCASCHLDGRSDGVSWSLDGKPLQTPVLAGRAFAGGTLRWHGDSPDVQHAIGEAIERLNGSGLRDDDLAALVAYLRSQEHEMAPRGTALDGRGAEVFAEAGCAGCHDPARDYSDGTLHGFRGGEYRTPSLRGLRFSAPYYHDGSAATIAGLLGKHEANNPMAAAALLSASDRRALEAFLTSL